MSKIIDLSVECGRKRQSKETGFLHYCFENSEKHQETIPFLENAYFILALFRTKMVEPILEAKSLLQRLLSFQVEGNFPVYLHDFPICKNHFLSFHLLPIFQVILQDFDSILGEDLKVSLQKTVQKIISYGLQIEKEKNLSFGAKVKLDAALGRLEIMAPKSVYEWGDYLIAAQRTPLFSEVWKMGTREWNPILGAYVGSEYFPKQEKREPVLSVFDLFMAESLQQYPNRINSDSIVMLQGSIVFAHPFIDGHKHSSFSTRQFSSQNFEVLWEDEGSLHSLVCEKGKCEIDIKKNQGGLHLTFVFPDSPMQEGESEIAFYYTAHPGNTVSIEEKKGTLFQLGEKVIFASAQKKVPLQFSSGEGAHFTGHISYGNRSWQMAANGPQRFHAFDHKVILRSVKRPFSHMVKAELMFSQDE